MGNDPRMTKSVKVPQTVHQRAQEIKEEYDYATLGEAIRHMCRRGDFEV